MTLALVGTGASTSRSVLLLVPLVEGTGDLAAYLLLPPVDLLAQCEYLVAQPPVLCCEPFVGPAVLIAFRLWLL